MNEKSPEDMSHLKPFLTMFGLMMALGVVAYVLKQFVL